MNRSVVVSLRAGARVFSTSRDMLGTILDFELGTAESDLERFDIGAVIRWDNGQELVHFAPEFAKNDIELVQGKE